MHWNLVDILLIFAVLLAILAVIIKEAWPRLITASVIVGFVACVIWRHPLGS